MPKRESALSKPVTQSRNIQNDALLVYDTSRPYTDERAHIDVTKGLNALGRHGSKKGGIQ
ncbi:hypothetical protein, partial [Bacillus pumilus]